MDKREMADLMCALFDPANMPAIPEWAIKAQEEWLEWASPIMGVTPSMTAKRPSVSERFFLRPVWHDNYPTHIDYEALRREL